ncbi:MAG: heme ABC exporter ATP-binding protein CcmA [bacterium]|nr:heme ABC exporter ATP-binding protein CcmA [bacterium]
MKAEEGLSNPEGGGLRLAGLTKRYGYRRALIDVELDLAAGEIVCLLGPNGAGKSTLLSALTSRNPPDGGEIFFQDRPVRTIEERRAFLAGIGFLGHEPGLFLDMTAAENLSFFLSINDRRYTARKRDASEYRKRVDELLTRTGLAGRRDDRVRTYSRGMQQRLGLCRVFLTQPDLVLLDEPLTGLDREGAQAMRELLRDFAARGGAALITTHDEDFFRETASRYVFLKQGRLIADITADRYTPASRARVHEMLYGTPATV